MAKFGERTAFTFRTAKGSLTLPTLPQQQPQQQQNTVAQLPSQQQQNMVAQLPPQQQQNTVAQPSVGNQPRGGRNSK
jgi:hypothetical protein